MSSFAEIVINQIKNAKVVTFEEIETEHTAGYQMFVDGRYIFAGHQLFAGEWPPAAICGNDTLRGDWDTVDEIQEFMEAYR